MIVLGKVISTLVSLTFVTVCVFCWSLFSLGPCSPFVLLCVLRLFKCLYVSFLLS